MSTRSKLKAPPRRLRALGTLEWFLFARTKAHADSCVVVAARYVTDQSGAIIDKGSLFPALGKVVRNNVVLASRIAPPPHHKNGRPEWVRLPSLDLNSVVEFIDDDFTNIDTVLESQFKRGFDPNASLPLWRLAVLRDGTIIFAFDHAMCDGLSGAAFHRMLLKELQQNRTSPTSVRFPDDRLPPPALEEATEISVPWGKVFSEMLKLFNPLAWKHHFATWAGNPIPKSFELDMHVHILTYSPAETEHLLELSRENHSTLTSTLHTLALLVLSRLLHKHERGRFAYATTYVPISLRRFTGAGANDLCNHYSYYFSRHKLFTPLPMEHFPWHDAGKFAKQLRDEVPRAASAMGLLKLVGSPGTHEQFVRRPLGKKRFIAIELSNLGAFAGDPEEKGGRDSMSTQERKGEANVEQQSRSSVSTAPVEAADTAQRAPADAGDARDPSVSEERNTDGADNASSVSSNSNGDNPTKFVHDKGPSAPPGLPSTAEETESPTPDAATVQRTNDENEGAQPAVENGEPGSERSEKEDGPTVPQTNGTIPKEGTHATPDVIAENPALSDPASAPNQDSNINSVSQAHNGAAAGGVPSGANGVHAPKGALQRGRRRSSRKSVQVRDDASAASPPSWSIREVVFAQGDGTLGAALKVSATGTPAGGLGIAITWGKSAIDEEFGKEFVVGFAAGMRGLLAGGPI